MSTWQPLISCLFVRSFILYVQCHDALIIRLKHYRHFVLGRLKICEYVKCGVKGAIGDSLQKMFCYAGSLLR